jgi:hypothetical protein
MIATQQINSIMEKPISIENYEIINVLKLNNSEWKNLSPYLINIEDKEIFSYLGKIFFEILYEESNNSIKYPIKKHRRKKTKIEIIDRLENKNNLNYFSTQKEIYVKEYIKLIKKLPEYTKLLNKIKNNKNIMICEINVPAIFKKGEYQKDCNVNNICFMSIDKLKLLLNDTNELFGHGLCLAYSLLLDLEEKK